MRISAGALLTAAVVVANAVSADVPHGDRDARAVSAALDESSQALAINVPITWPGCRERGIDRAQPPSDDHVQFALPVQLRGDGKGDPKPRVHAAIDSVQVKQGGASSVQAAAEQGTRRAEIQLVVVTIRLTVDAPRQDKDEPTAESPACGAALETRL